MLRRELEENLKDLSHELTRRIPSFLNDALVKVNIKSVPPSPPISRLAMKRPPN